MYLLQAIKPFKGLCANSTRVSRQTSPLDIPCFTHIFPSILAIKTESVSFGGSVIILSLGGNWSSIVLPEPAGLRNQKSQVDLAPREWMERLGNC